MNIEIRYYTLGGNTKKLAKTIEEELNITAKSIETPLDKDIDILFLCNSVYAFSTAEPVKNFLINNKKNIAKIYNISSASLVKSTYKSIKRICSKYHLNLSNKEFHCKGSYKNKSKKGKTHPDEKDLENLREFIREVVKL